jgi:hypothetical protein
MSQLTTIVNCKTNQTNRVIVKYISSKCSYRGPSDLTHIIS